MPAGLTEFPEICEKEHKPLQIKEEEPENLQMKEEMEILHIKMEEPDPVQIKEEPEVDLKEEKEKERFEDKPKDGSRKKRKRPLEESVDLDREILRALQARPHVHPPPPPLSETELFMKSLIPMIDSLPPLRRGALKLKIHSLVFEAVSDFL